MKTKTSEWSWTRMKWTMREVAEIHHWFRIRAEHKESFKAWVVHIISRATLTPHFASLHHVFLRKVWAHSVSPLHLPFFICAPRFKRKSGLILLAQLFRYLSSHFCLYTHWLFIFLIKINNNNKINNFKFF